MITNEAVFTEKRKRDMRKSLDWPSSHPSMFIYESPEYVDFVTANPFFDEFGIDKLHHVSKKVKDQYTKQVCCYYPAIEIKVKLVC
jgi:hypothetical protein